MNDDTALYRQINPSFLQNGRPTSIAFRPFPRDDHKLSVYDGGMISAERSWVHFTQELKYKSAGAMGVIVRECSSIELPTASSPEHFAEHAHIDFTGLSKSQISDKSKLLTLFANERGWAYKPED